MHDDRQLMARWLTPRKTPHTDPKAASPMVLGPDGWKPPTVKPNPEAEAQFREGERLFQQGKLAEAERVFARLAKKHKGTPWGEKGQFYAAEAQFQAGRYVAAHDSLERLIADYPGTEYLDKLVNREYTIAQTWLAADDPKAKAEAEVPCPGTPGSTAGGRSSTPRATPSRCSSTSATTTRPAPSPTTPS